MFAASSPCCVTLVVLLIEPLLYVLCAVTRGLLIQRGVVSLFGDFYLGDVSPIRSYASPKRQSMGNMHTKPVWDPLVKCMLLLLRGGVDSTAALSTADLVRWCSPCSRPATLCFCIGSFATWSLTDTT